MVEDLLRLSVLVLLFIGFLLRTIYKYHSILNSSLPPGPPPRFWTGNFSDYPSSQPWLTFTDWAQKYGPIFRLRIFNSEIIVLNTATSALDLLEHRSNIYSDRPISWVVGELGGRKKTMFRVRADDPDFKTYRKLIHTGLSPRATQSYKSIQEQEIGTLLHALSETPEDFISHMRRNAIGLILKVSYGYEVKSINDPWIEAMEEEFNVLSPRIALPFAADFLPWLRFLPEWFPFTDFHRFARRLREIRSETAPFEWTKRQIESGKYVESFTSRLLFPRDGSPPDEKENEIIKWCSGALYVGGADTTVSAMVSMILLMALYPEVQKRAQAEIDLVVGKERLPSVEDRDSMPYVTALVKEIVRWAPVVPLGLRHRAMEDDVYEGYRIPKGSTIVPNIWAIMHDAKLYPDPFHFDPERHLGDNPQTNPFKFAFGFGRRVCPGAHFAEVSLAFNISNVLAVFDIAKAKDINGNIIVPEIAWTSGITRHPKPFKCSITLRSPQSEALINDVHR